MNPSQPTDVSVVVDTIKSRILTGTYRPGHSIPSAEDLADELGVDARIVIEAVAELRNQGYLFILFGPTAFVRERHQWSEDADVPATSRVGR